MLSKENGSLSGKRHDGGLSVGKHGITAHDKDTSPICVNSVCGRVNTYLLSDLVVDQPDNEGNHNRSSESCDEGGLPVSSHGANFSQSQQSQLGDEIDATEFCIRISGNIFEELFEIFLVNSSLFQLENRALSLKLSAKQIKQNPIHCSAADTRVLSW